MNSLLLIILIAVVIYLDAVSSVTSVGKGSHEKSQMARSKGSITMGKHSDDHQQGSPDTTGDRTSIFSTINAKGEKVLTYYGLMLAGAIARSVSATAVHPLNVIKTLLQTKGGGMPELKWNILSRGAGSQLIMSIPHGAVSFGVTEVIYNVQYSYIEIVFL